MSWLYWSCPVEAFGGLEPLNRGAALRFKIAGEVGDFLVLTVDDLSPQTVILTAKLLGAGRISSAAIVRAPLSPDDLWLAVEWRHRLVVERSALEGLQDLTDVFAQGDVFPPRDLAIFTARELQSPVADGPSWREEAAHHVREQPQAYYGDLADPDIGGANVLYAAGLEAARLRGLREDRVIIGGPEDYGFTRDEGAESMVAWRLKRIIAVEAVGFSLGSEEQLDSLFGRYKLRLDSDRYREDVDSWRRQGLAYGVGLVLRGLEDPPVVIPVGSVFQQPAMGALVQNLAVAQPATAMVAAGATVPLILPAWCLNQSFAPPHGPVTPTPLVATLAQGGQQDVWADIEDRYRRGQ